MINAILNGLLGIIQTLLNVLLAPINLLFANIFPDMTSAISTFTTFVNTYIGSNLAWFFSLLPPTFRSLLGLWFTFVIAYYSIYYTYIAAIKIFGIIQKIKFW